MSTVEDQAYSPGDKVRLGKGKVIWTVTHVNENGDTYSLESDTGRPRSASPGQLTRVEGVRADAIAEPLDAGDEAPLTKTEADQLTERIRVALGTVWKLVLEAWRRGAHTVLEYKSWDAYCKAEFGTDRIKLPVEERLQAVAELRAAGMSKPETAAALGVSVPTVARDRAAISSDTGKEDTAETLERYRVQSAQAERLKIEADEGKQRDMIAGMLEGWAAAEAKHKELIADVCLALFQREDWIEETHIVDLKNLLRETDETRRVIVTAIDELTSRKSATA